MKTIFVVASLLSLTTSILTGCATVLPPRQDSKFAPPANLIMASAPVILSNIVDDTKVACAMVIATPAKEKNLVFWEQFERLFYSSKTSQMDAAIGGNIRDFYVNIAPVWRRMAGAVPSAREMIRAEWKAALALEGNAQAMNALQGAQLDLFRCFYPATGGQPNWMLSDEAVNASFSELALGLLKREESEPHKMDLLLQWFFWAAFTDSILYGSERSPAQDRENWGKIFKAILTGMLLHAHHNPQPPDPARDALKSFLPPGLVATGREDIETYAAQKDVKSVAEVIYGLYRLLPTSYARTPPNLAKPTNIQ